MNYTYNNYFIVGIVLFCIIIIIYFQNILEENAEK